MDTGLGSDASRSLIQGQRPDSNEKLGGKNPRARVQDDDMELGYEDNVLPETFEGLEQRFIQDIMKLTKEHQDAEDTENARHREVSSTVNLRKQHICHVFVDQSVFYYLYVNEMIFLQPIKRKAFTSTSL